jgi:hypothetical protein
MDLGENLGWMTRSHPYIVVKVLQAFLRMAAQ